MNRWQLELNNILAVMTDLLNPAVLALAMGFIGLIVGSFLNVVIHRLPQMLEQDWRAQCAELLGQQAPGREVRYTLAYPRSHCPHCGHILGWFENIPLLSYLWQGGKCTECHAPISLRYPLVELTSGLLAAVVAWRYGWGGQVVGALLLSWALIVLSSIDIEHQLLPDSITLPFLWLGLLFNLYGLYTDLESSVVGAMAGYLILWGVYKCFKAVTGKEGMGYGDFKLLAMLGAWMGWQSLPLVIILSSLVGALIGIGLTVFKSRDKDQPIPFGPYLACAGWIALLWGNDITGAYLQWTLGSG